MKTRPLMFFIAAAGATARMGGRVRDRLHVRMNELSEAGKNELPENYDSWSTQPADFKPTGYARIRREARRRRNIRRLSPKH